MTEEVASTTSSVPTYEPENEKSEIAMTEKLVIQSTIITPSPTVHRIFAPLNIPLYRRRQTLTILTWLLMPWLCLYISLLLLRCHNWYVVGAFIGYLTWMVFFQKFPSEGGLKQQWLRRLVWWKWFAGK
jgi:2-acylglycerol O-acyltransferase 2